MSVKVTKNTVEYPKNQEPNLIIPNEYKPYRYIIGKQGLNPLIAICMNPSAARDDKSDRTINRIINISTKLNYDGWIVFNIYPERATNAANMDAYNEDLAISNLEHLRNYIIQNKVKEIWGSWGDLNHKTLRSAKTDVLNLLNSLGVDIFYFGTLTASGNPRHPLQRRESWEKMKYPKKYLKLHKRTNTSYCI